MLGLKGDNMYTVIEKYGWKFSFDKDKTSKYYKDYSELCQCESCENFYKNIKLISNDIRDFLVQFGIDIAKPIEQESIIANKSKQIVENTVYYAVNGNVVSTGTYDIHLGQSTIEVIPNEISPNTDISQPYFVLVVRDIWLPWTVDYNIDDIYD